MCSLGSQQHMDDNPNIPAQDNGMNAWLDTQLDPNAFTQDEHEQVRYARRNSDLSRFYDIDDVQLQGPTTSTQKVNSAQLDINQENIRKAAQYLMNNDNIPFCRKTSIRLEEELSNEDDTCPPHLCIRSGHQLQHNMQKQSQPRTRSMQLRSIVVNVARDRYLTSDQIDRDEHDEYSDEYDVIKQFNEQLMQHQDIPHRQST